MVSTYVLATRTTGAKYTGGDHDSASSMYLRALPCMPAYHVSSLQRPTTGADDETAVLVYLECLNRASGYVVVSDHENSCVSVYVCAFTLIIASLYNRCPPER